MDYEGKVTQQDRILGLLKDGCYHSGLEFTRLTRPVLSYTKRISELRRLGHNISGKKILNVHWYRLEEK